MKTAAEADVMVGLVIDTSVARQCVFFFETSGKFFPGVVEDVHYIYIIYIYTV